MSTTAEPQMPMRGPRRRSVAIALARALITTTVLTVAYFVLPLTDLARLPFAVIVVAGVIILIAVIVFQVRSVMRAEYPAVTAVEALTVTAPLFLLLFAATYYLMSQADPANFNLPGLTRSDTLYFTVTIFTTVGFGDIVASSHSARAMVTVQMVLDLILIGAVIRVFIAAVKQARGNRAAPSANT